MCNNSLQEFGHSLLGEKPLTQSVTSSINRVYLRLGTEKKTPHMKYERRRSNYQVLPIFGSKYYILRDKANLAKFINKSDERIFIGYSLSSRAYRVYNEKNEIMMKSINMVVDDDTTEAHSEGQGPGRRLLKIASKNRVQILKVKNHQLLSIKYCLKNLHPK